MTLTSHAGKITGEEGIVKYDAWNGCIEYQGIGGQPEGMPVHPAELSVDPGVTAEWRDLIASIHAGVSPRWTVETTGRPLVSHRLATCPLYAAMSSISFCRGR